MNQLKHNKTFSLAATAILAVATMGLGGCSGKLLKPKPNPDAGEEFLAVDEESNVTRLNDLHIAGGSRTDATLRAYHFHRGALNSLGRQKLDQMIAAEAAAAEDAGGDDGEAMVVYLDATAGAGASEEAAKRLSAARQDAVSDYLMGRGLAEDAFRIEMGHNPDDTFLASSAAGTPAAAEGAPGAPAPAGGAPAGGAPASGIPTK